MCTFASSLLFLVSPCSRFVSLSLFSLFYSFPCPLNLFYFVLLHYYYYYYFLRLFSFNFWQFFMMFLPIAFFSFFYACRSQPLLCLGLYIRRTMMMIVYGHKRFRNIGRYCQRIQQPSLIPDGCLIMTKDKGCLNMKGG